MRHIPFRSRISLSAIEDLLEELRAAGPASSILVDSPGGQFEFFSVVGPAIQRQGVTTFAGNVRSAAVILYLLGYRRFAHPESTFFFHEVRTLVSMDSPGVTICDLEAVMEYQEHMSGQSREIFEEWLRRMRNAQAWFLDFMFHTVGISRGTLIDLMRAEATMSAAEAKYYGLVHEIVPRELVFINE